MLPAGPRMRADSSCARSALLRVTVPACSISNCPRNPMANEHDPYRALRHRDYRLLLGAGILSSIGGEIQAVAVGWELYARTQDPAALGLAGLLQFLPVLL